MKEFCLNAINRNTTENVNEFEGVTNMIESNFRNPRPIGGSKHEIMLWNRVGRGRVLQLMKREIPKISPFFLI